jgi:isocitrate dehydrogenase (NAD+)
MRSVTLIPGDGVGPEITAATRWILDEVTAEIAWEEVIAGEAAFRSVGSSVPDETESSLRRTRLGLKGPLTNPGKGYPSPTRELRKVLDLWCNVRIGAAWPGTRTRFPGTALTVIRDTTEDLGAGAEQFVGPDAGIAIKTTTRAASARLAKFVLEYATRVGHKRITVAHNATILRTTDGIFLSAMMDEPVRHPGIQIEGELLDSLLMHLVQDPSDYEVIVAPNFYGGFLCGICSGLTGGVGLMAGANLGEGDAAIFEPAHGTVPKYAGQGRVNPTAMILSGALLLDHLGLRAEADSVREAVRTVMRDGQHLTYDQGGSASTTEMAKAVIEELHRA